MHIISKLSPAVELRQENLLNRRQDADDPDLSCFATHRQRRGDFVPDVCQRPSPDHSARGSDDFCPPISMHRPHRLWPPCPPSCWISAFVERHVNERHPRSLLRLFGSERAGLTWGPFQYLSLEHLQIGKVP